MSMPQEHALWTCWCSYMDHHHASCAGTEMRSFLQWHALWKRWSCCTNQSCTMCRDKAVVFASRACNMELLVLLHTPPCCIMCGDKQVVPATRACTLDVLVLLDNPQSCIMCLKTAAVLATRACILKVLVLLHRPPCCIMCSDSNYVPARGACTLKALVLLHRPHSSIMCNDENAVPASRACTLKLWVLLHRQITHHVQGQRCCPWYMSMHSGSVGPATQATILHHVQRQSFLPLLQEHAFCKRWSCYPHRHTASCAWTKTVPPLQKHAL
jgi:hypothetical protein